jgi:hypothetical protein
VAVQASAIATASVVADADRMRRTTEWEARIASA